MKPTLLTAILSAIACAAPAAAGDQPCQPEWESEQFCRTGLNGGVFCATLWDDGSGDSVYVAGSMVSTGCTPLSSIARQTSDGWEPLDGIGDLDATVYDLVPYNDGTGSALYAAGLFTHAGGHTVNRVAKWDGAAWSALGEAGSPGLDPAVPYSFNVGVIDAAVFDDGTGAALYVAGIFTLAGNTPANNIARWDGTSWSALDDSGVSGVDGPVYAIEVFDDGSGPALFAAGEFSSAGTTQAARIAKWDGSSWTALSGPAGTGVNGTVRALEVADDGNGPALYAGGAFTTAGGVIADRIARWDGQTWAPLTGSTAQGVNGYVRALAAHESPDGPVLLVGGDFYSAGGVPVTRLARWDGNDWAPLQGGSGEGIDGLVRSITQLDATSAHPVYVCGSMGIAGGNPTSDLALWDGNDWHPVDPPGPDEIYGISYELVSSDFDGTPRLYAGGSIRTAGIQIAGGIASWDGASWSTLAGPNGTAGMNDRIESLEIFNDGTGSALYAGGRFTTAGGGEANHIARWDGNAWTPLEGPDGNGMTGFGTVAIYALEVFDDGQGDGPVLFAAGNFATAGGVETKYLARWDGTQWAAVEPPSPASIVGQIQALHVFDGSLYIGASFNTNHAAGAETFGILRWNGETWSDVAGGLNVNAVINDMAIFDDGSGPALYIAGWNIHEAGGVPVDHIARWDGTNWSALGPPNAPGLNSEVESLAVFDDGTGPALYAGGIFDTAAGTTVEHIARWDGQQWHAIAGPEGFGISSRVYALAAHDGGDGPALFAGGPFSTAGGTPSVHIAKLPACTTPSPCSPADIALPYSTLDLADITAFITAFAAADPIADLADPTGVFDLADLVAFAQAFQAGCP